MRVGQCPTKNLEVLFLRSVQDLETVMFKRQRQYSSLFCISRLINPRFVSYKDRASPPLCLCHACHPFSQAFLHAASDQKMEAWQNKISKIDSYFLMADILVTLILNLCKQFCDSCGVTAANIFVSPVTTSDVSIATCIYQL